MDYISITVLALCIIIIAAFAIIVKPKKLTEEQKKRLKGKFYADRGLYRQDQSIPENSMSAFRLAVRRNYGIKLDVRMTKDGRIVVFHDESLKRVCGAEKTRVRKLSYEELAQYRLFNTDEKIPLLSQVLDEVDGKVSLLIEMKISDESQITTFCENLMAMLQNYSGSYAVLSAEPRALVWFKRNAPDVLRGVVTDGFQEKSKKLSDMQRFMRRHLFYNFKTKPHIISCGIGGGGSFGAKICMGIFKPLSAVWTVREELDSAKLRSDFNMLIFEFYDPN